MEILNYSNQPLNKLVNWLPINLKIEKVIFFPDVCPGKSSLPTGSCVFTTQSDWRKYAVSDCGCGMLLLKSSVKSADFDHTLWDNVYNDLKENKGKLGDLGSGNHFLDALEPYDDDKIHFLIHTGSRNESKHIINLIEQPKTFDKEHRKICLWAQENRHAIAEVVSKYFGILEPIIDRDHNNFELTNNGVIIRKGAVKINPGELSVIPSNMVGDVVLVKATEDVKNTFHSLNHGTGRVMSRSEAKKIAEKYDYRTLRKKIYIPPMIKNASIKTEAPFCYRNLEEGLHLVENLINIQKRFSPIAYLGQI